MTISTTTSRAQYAGNGVTTIFSFPYRFLANGDLEVTLFDAAGAPSPQTLTTDYTVLGADNDAGGSVTMLVAPAVGETLVIRRVVALTQETDYISGDSFPAETHERALDRLTMVDQQLQEQVDRSITLPLDNETFSSAMPAIVPGYYLKINDAGTAFEMVALLDPGTLVVTPFMETLFDDATAAAARATLGAQAAGNYAASGANSDITSLAGLTTPLAMAQGGTGANHANVAALFNAIKQAASETATGVVELATDAEAQAGTDTTRALTPANLAAARSQLGTLVTLSGVASAEFAKPSWARGGTLILYGASLSDANNFRVQFGTASAWETTGYAGSTLAAITGAVSSGTADTAGIPIFNNGAANVTTGGMDFFTIGSNFWIAKGVFIIEGGGISIQSGGRKGMPDAVTRVRLVPAGGAATLDGGGAANVLWWA